MMVNYVNKIFVLEFCFNLVLNLIGALTQRHDGKNKINVRNSMTYWYISFIHMAKKLNFKSPNMTEIKSGSIGVKGLFIKHALNETRYSNESLYIHAHI